jgi:hypothetical protein
MRKQELLAITPSSDTPGLLQSLHQFLQTPALREAQADTEISYAEFYKFLQQSGKQALLQSLDLENETMVRFLQQWQLEAAEDNSKRDIQLPNEIWCRIFSFFKGNELYQTMMVSKQFCNLTKSVVPLTLDYTIPPQYQFMHDQIKGNIHQLKMLDQNRLMIVLSYDVLKAIDQEINFQFTEAEKLNACICIFDIETGRCLQALNSQMKEIKTIKLTPNNEIICYGNGILQILDLRSGRCKKRFESSVAHYIDMTVSPNGNIITHSSEIFKGILEVWDDAMEKLKHTFSHVNYFAVLTNDDIVCGTDQSVMLWDSQTEKYRPITPLPFKHIAEMPNGDIVSDYLGGRVQVWDRKTRERKLTYKGHIRPVASIVAFPNGDIASSAGDEIHIWDGYGRERTKDSKCILKMTIPEISRGGQTIPVRLRLLNKNILMSHYDDCDAVIFWQFSETKKLPSLIQGSPPTYQLSIRGQSKILPDNLGMKTDCLEEELENLRLRLERQLYRPPSIIVEHNQGSESWSWIDFIESGLSDDKEKTDSDEFSDDEEETDSDLFSEDKDPDDPAPSIRST